MPIPRSTSPLRSLLKSSAIAALALLPFAAADAGPQIGVFFNQAEVSAADCGSYSCTLMGGSMSWQDAGSNYGFSSETWFEGDVITCEEDGSAISSDYLWTTGYASSNVNDFPTQENDIVNKATGAAIGAGLGSLASDGFDFLITQTKNLLGSRLDMANALLPSTSYMSAAEGLLGFSQTVAGRAIGASLGGF